MPGESTAVTRTLVRLLPALAITLGLLGIAISTSSVAAIVSGALVGCAAALELTGWGTAARCHARTLGTAALLGAVVVMLGLGFVLVLDPGAAGDREPGGVALRAR